MSSNPITRDLGSKLQLEIGQVVERNLKVAQHVLEPADLTILMIEATVSLMLSTASTAAASTDDASNSGSMFDLTIELIAASARGDRTRALDAVTARRAEARR